MQNGLVTFLPLILLVVFFYFFIMRPQNKQKKEIQAMRDNMKPGDEILTIGGFYVIIYAIDDENIVLEMLPDFHKAMIVKSAVSKVIKREETEDDTEEETTESVSEPETIEEVQETQDYNDSPVEDAEFEEVTDENVEVGEEVDEDKK